MALKVVLDSTVLVSAFLRARPGGVSFDVLQSAREQAFEVFISDAIVAEVSRVLLSRGHIRRRYGFADTEAADYIDGLKEFTIHVADPPQVKVVRDPTDDMILACALAAGAAYLVTRDDDLLSLKSFSDIQIVRPEEFLHILRRENQ